jgi:hypothetical protein
MRLLVALSAAVSIAWIFTGCSSSGDTTGGVVDDPAATCADVCQAYVDLGCLDASECQGACASTLAHAGACGGAVEAYFQCEADNVMTCDETHDTTCASEDSAVTSCGGADDCLGEDATFTGSSCSGTSGCSTGAISVSCHAGASGDPWSCTCSVGGQQVGTCQSPTTALCDLQNGCCAQFF